MTILFDFIDGKSILLKIVNNNFKLSISSMEMEIAFLVKINSF